MPETMSIRRPNRFLFRRSSTTGASSVSLPHAHRLPDVVNVVANHHLKLAADHHNHARVFLQPFRIRPLILFQFEAKPGRAVNKTDDVLFSANVAENILR
jgi:hypothetical protein